MWRAARWALGLIVLAWTVVLLAWLVLHWAILPHIDEWRPALEREATRTLGVQVRVESIKVSSGGWIPALELREVRLLDPQGRVALRLPRVAAALSARSLLAFELRFEQLLIDAPQLEIRRDEAGRIFVAGLSVDEAEHAETAGLAEEWADWFFSQHEFIILNGRVRWIDERRAKAGAAPLDLSDVNFKLRNGLRGHAMRLDATPPPAWGQRFGLRGRFTQSLLRRPGELRHWSGQLFADLPHADLRELRRHIDLPFELSEGDGALRAWVDIKNGQPQGATVDMGLRAVKLRLSDKAEELELEKIEGRLQLQHEPQRLSLKATQLGFVSLAADGPGVVWPRSDWGIELRLAESRGAAAMPFDAATVTVLGGDVTAERLDFAQMAQVAARLPIGETPRALLAEMAPQGVLSGLSGHWEGALEAPRSYRVKARLDGLKLAARASAQEHHLGRPGIAGASLQLEATERGGQARLAIDNGSLDLPGLFEEPLLPLKKLSTEIHWTIEPRNGQLPQWSLKLADLRLANDDLRGEFDIGWRTGLGDRNTPRLPGILDLSGRIDRIDATRVHRYLPLGVGEHARAYVRDAIRGGEARAVTARVRGDLHDFPFDGPGRREGQFRIVTQARDIQLAYVPPAAGQPPAWPALEHIDAELVFERGGMQIRNGRAKVLGYELTGINGGIQDLIHAHVLEIEGAGRGPLAELLRFMRASPVDEWTSHALSQASATGAAALKLELQLPLGDIAKSSVKGAVQLLGNDLRLRPDVPLFGNTRARVDFDRKGVTVQAGQARILGGDASFDGGSQRDGSLRFNAQGLVTAEALRRAPELGTGARLAQAASGLTAYRLQLGFVQGQTEFSLTSSLQGLGLDLPAPLKKEAEAQLPLRVQTVLQGGGRDELRVELGNTLQAHYLRDVAAEPARVLRGALAVQDNLPGLPPAGVLLQANLASVNLDDWSNRLEQLTGSSAAALGGGDGGEGAAYMPTQIGLRAQSLIASGRPLTKLVAGITHATDTNSWRFSLDAEQLSGFVELRAARPGQPGRVHARLARLSLPRQEADSVSQMLDQQPGSVPALDIVVEDFELRGKRLGRLEVEAQAGSGNARDWRLNRLQLKHPDAVLNATGQWLAEAAGPRRTVLDWKLDVADAGDLLERMGQGRVLRGGKGQLAGRIGWQGSPMSPDYASMTGQLNVALDKGQFLKAEPGVGRLLGVLSLQSLPRRFLLDFRDVFSEGFAFDGATGDVKIDKGVASSSNLRVHGVAAAVLLEGSANLAAETQNLRVLVVPEVSAGGAALAYAAINPAIGLGAFLAQLVLSRPMAAANTREFHITGGWDDPKVERVEHKAPEEAAASTPKSQESVR